MTSQPSESVREKIMASDEREAVKFIRSRTRWDGSKVVVYPDGRIVRYNQAGRRLKPDRFRARNPSPDGE